jgi:hypothetical protein
MDYVIWGPWLFSENVRSRIHRLSQVQQELQQARRRFQQLGRRCQS